MIFLAANIITLLCSSIYSSMSPTSLLDSSKAFRSNTTRMTFISCISRNLLIVLSVMLKASASAFGKPYTPVAISGKAMLSADNSAARAKDFS